MTFPPDNAICRENGGGGNRTRERGNTDYARMQEFVYRLLPYRRVESRRTFIYAARDAQGRYKIGESKDPVRRLAQLQNAHADPLELAAVFFGTVAIESGIHIELSEHRIRGEWFAPHPDVTAVIALLQTFDHEPGVIPPDTAADRDTRETIKGYEAKLKTRTPVRALSTVPACSTPEVQP